MNNNVIEQLLEINETSGLVYYDVVYMKNENRGFVFRRFYSDKEMRRIYFKKRPHEVLFFIENCLKPALEILGETESLYFLIPSWPDEIEAAEDDTLKPFFNLLVNSTELELFSRGFTYPGDEDNQSIVELWIGKTSVEKLSDLSIPNLSENVFGTIDLGLTLTDAAASFFMGLYDGAMDIQCTPEKMEEIVKLYDSIGFPYTDIGKLF